MSFIITALAIKDGLLYAISKAHNIMIVIDPKQKSIIDVYGLPNILTNIRAMTFVENELLVVGYDNSKHTVYCFKFLRINQGTFTYLDKIIKVVLLLYLLRFEL